MVQADQIEDGQPASFPDVLQCLVGERDRDSVRPSVLVLRFSDRPAEPKRWTLSPGGTTSQHHAVFQLQFRLQVAEEQEFLAIDVYGCGVLGQIGQDE